MTTMALVADMEGVVVATGTAGVAVVTGTAAVVTMTTMEVRMVRLNPIVYYILSKCMMLIDEVVVYCASWHHFSSSTTPYESD